MAAKIGKKTAYDDQSIKSLKGAERVRKRPAVIFGSDDLIGCQHSFIEILANSVDEAREGYGSKIIVKKYRDLSIEVEDERIVQRMSGRRACPSCGMTYHVEFKHSKDNKNCDGCCTERVIRNDDKPETVLERLKIYHDQTEPLKEYYGSRDKLVIVEGQEELKDTTALTFKAIEGFCK